MQGKSTHYTLNYASRFLSGCGGKAKYPHTLLVLLQSIANHVIDRAIPAPCGQNNDILITSEEDTLLVLLQSIANHVIDRAIPAPCGQNNDILITSEEERLNFYQTCIWNRHEHFHATCHFNITVINLKYI